MSRVYIIAEAGVNHNGDIELAKKMIDVAVQAGVDAIKFQTFVSGKLACKSAPKAQYQKENTGKEETQLEMLKKLELTEENHCELLAYCIDNNIEFISSPFDISSMEYLYGLGMRKLKIPSGEITNYPYLKRASALFRDIIISTGMSTLEEVQQAIAILQEGKEKNITILHCHTQYPTKMEDVHLRAMISLGKETSLKYGYSDHTQGIEIPIAAVAMGATVIEKHFTLDKSMDGPDHKASLNPDELIAMVESIRNIEKALGSKEKHVTSSESENRDIVRKSMVASKPIQKGEVFTENNLTTKRPGNGISPMRWNEIIGTTARRDYQEDEMIEE